MSIGNKGFNTAYQKFETKLVEVLINGGEFLRVDRVLSNLRLHEKDFMFFYMSGCKAKQIELNQCKEKIKQLQAEINDLKAVNTGTQIGHNVFTKQLKERHEQQVSGLAKVIEKLYTEGDEMQRRIDAIAEILHGLKDGMYGESRDIQIVAKHLDRALEGG